MSDLEELELKQKLCGVARNEDLFLNNKVIQRNSYIFLASLSNIEVAVERFSSFMEISQKS